MSVITQAPLGVLLGGGMVAGLAGSTAHIATMDGDDGVRPLVHALGGAALTGAGLIGAMSVEDIEGPYVTRHVVDGAEQISRRTVNLDWSTRGGRIGALVSGVGLAFMATTLPAMSAGTGGARPEPTIRIPPPSPPAETTPTPAAP